MVIEGGVVGRVHNLDGCGFNLKYPVTVSGKSENKADLSAVPSIFVALVLRFT
jgi:hypothetical protein